ncbi:MAG: hypothetical protein F4X44_03375 [Gammaproteobacteria bacterium]|nr:hypothetical protein [Gammaproteobacteria bacterium]MYD79636.1 hypothetical protein [Gammaproteobacteria bacterium]
MTRVVEVETVLRLFAEGITGHPFQIHEAGAITEPFAHNPNRISLKSSFNLYLPEDFSFFPSDTFNRRAFLYLVLQQLAYREFRTYAFDINQARSKISFLRDRPSPVSHLESDLELFYQHFDNQDLARRLFHLIESERVTKHLLRKYEGAQVYRRDFQPFVNSLHAIDPINLIEREIVQLSGHLRNVPGYTSSLVGLIDFALTHEADVYDSAEATIACYQALEKFGTLPREFDLDSKSDFRVSLESLQRQARIEEWERELSDLELEFEGIPLPIDQIEGSESDVLGSANSVDEVQRDHIQKQKEQLSRRLQIEKSSVGLSPSRTEDVIASFRYDEWDYLNSKWLRNWCLLHEYSMNEELAGDSAGLKRAIRPHVQSVRKLFEQIRPAGLKRVRRQFEGDELDISATVDLRVDCKSQVSPDERVYSRRDRIHRDVATVVLVDLSASTDSPIDVHSNDTSQDKDQSFKDQDLRDPYFDDERLNSPLDSTPFESDNPVRRVIDIQREAVLLLATSLDSIQDMYAIYGFSGYGKENVEVFVAKEFDQALSEHRIAAVASMEPKRSTRMGPSIRHSTRKLLATGAAMKVLLIVSDGFPQDCDYGPDRTSHEYGVQDTAMALQEADRKGVKNFCVTVDLAGHDYLRRMCRKDRYLVIDELESLPLALNDAYSYLTAG